MPDPIICCVCQTSDEKHKFHRFPTQFPVVYREWIEALNLDQPPNKSDLVCSQHFNKKLHYWPHFRSPKAVLKDDAVPSLTRKVEKSPQKSQSRRTSKRLKLKNGHESLDSYGTTSESSDEEVVLKKSCLKDKTLYSKAKVVPKPNPPVEKVSSSSSSPPTAARNGNTVNSSSGFVARLEALTMQLQDHKWDNCAACLEKMTNLLDHITESHKLAIPRQSVIEYRLTSAQSPMVKTINLPSAPPVLKNIVTSKEQNPMKTLPVTNGSLSITKCSSTTPAVPKLLAKKEPLKKIPNILARRPIVKLKDPADHNPNLICLKMRKTSKDTKYICGECGMVMTTQESGVKHIQAHYGARRTVRLEQSRSAQVRNEPPKPIIDVPPVSGGNPAPENGLTTTTSTDITDIADKYCLAYISCETGSESKKFMDFLPENLIEYCPEDGD